ncbi:unnamed protein product [Kuraishia capsulata CBS 1993]|uniref:Uncharacterized protein n=1 Tax=Kuraishia capsulata CBS 1993 TaxID=1382522 RepID=W6MHG1_9ASCO|nr:uncharacterized protein KUCA_T00001080001 [Kuraishia capsulata CBS 1993]CDK25113.1 unnamed protein product [Kuraishia capsulata CBS 1993]
MLPARVLRAAARSAAVASIARSAPRVARPVLAARRYASAKAAPTEVSSILEEKIRGVSEEANLNETGRVLSVGYVSTFFSDQKADFSGCLFEIGDVGQKIFI